MEQIQPLLQYLMEDVRAFPVLSHAKETELFTLIRRSKSDKTRRETREFLINSNIRLAVSIAMKYLSKRVPIEDLVAAALEGLIRGIDRFDPGKGIKFSTYGTIWINHSITRALVDHLYRTPFRIPVHIVDDVKKVRRARWALEQQGKKITALEIAREAGIKPGKAHRILEMERTGAFMGVRSLETLEEEDIVPSKGIMCSEGDRSIEEIIDEERLIAEIFSYLRPKEAEITIRRFMGDTLAQISESLLVTRERIRQIQVGAARKIKAKFAGKYQ
jgi:RNA polymerase sigma factor (sigma-70 family)